MLISADSDIIAKLHMYYRSSVVGRRIIGNQLVNSTKKLDDFKDDPRITNRNVEILQAYLKAMGYRINFFGDEFKIDIKTGHLKSHETEDGLLICTDSEYEDFELRKDIESKYKNKVCLVTTKEDYEDTINKEFEKAKLYRDKYVIEIN